MRFFPTMYKKSIHDIDYRALKEKGVRCLLFDLDNTIGLIDQETLDSKTIQLFRRLKKDFAVTIVSNNCNRARVRAFSLALDCDSYPCAMKPSTHFLRKTQKKYGVSPKEMCFIGDQLMTDIWAANRFGCFSCLVDPLAKKDLKITSVNRFFENLVLKRYEKNNIMKRGEYYG